MRVCVPVVAQKSAKTQAPQSVVVGMHCASVVQPTQVSRLVSHTVPARHGETPSWTEHALALHVSWPLQSTPSSQLAVLGVCVHPEAVQASSVQALPSSQPTLSQPPASPPPSGVVASPPPSIGPPSRPPVPAS